MINLFHAAYEVVDTPDDWDVLSAIAASHKQGAGGKVGEPAHRPPYLRILPIDCHCYLVVNIEEFD